MKTHLPHRRARGFTLIELLVVITIVAIIVGAVVLNIEFRNTGAAVRDVSQRTALLMNLAADQAVYSRQQLGIRFHPNSYEFYILADAQGEEAEDDEKAWQILMDDRLKFDNLNVPLEFQVDISGVPIVLEELEEEMSAATDDDPLKPHIMFLSNGEIMPDFRVVIADADEGEYRHQVSSGEIEPIVVERLQ